MSYLKAQSLSHHYGGELLFSGVNLVLNPGDRVGIVGPNGVGKTTLLRVLAGHLRPAGGQLTVQARVGWSGPPDVLGQTTGAYLADGLGKLAQLERRLRELESAMAAGDPATLAEYASVQDAWSSHRGWAAEARLTAVRDRLGVAHLPDDLPLLRVSGGELARLTLARLLLAEPDVLVLDEPTNHLDADGANWLGRYLARFSGGVILASHDRAFLDEAVSQIIELDGIEPEPGYYQGGYSQYRAEKQRRWQRRLLDYEAQQKYRLRLESDIDAVKGQALQTELATRNDKARRYAKKVAKKAKAREHRLAGQIQAAAWLAEPQTRPPLMLALPPDPAVGGGPVLTARDVTVSLGGRAILSKVRLDLSPADRVLITGPNGSGKTTLLRMLSGEITPDAGRVTARHQPAVLPQRHDDLSGSMTVIDFLRSRVALYADEAEQLLTSYQFGAEQWRAPVRTLSDGELRRLLLAALVNGGSSILMLDEPTHYLDFDALDVIEEALRGYPGTLVMVTHDRYFADRVGFSRHWQVTDGTVTAVTRSEPAPAGSATS